MSNQVTVEITDSTDFDEVVAKHLMPGLSGQPQTRLATLLTNTQKYIDNTAFRKKKAAQRLLCVNIDNSDMEHSWNESFRIRSMGLDEAIPKVERNLLTREDEEVLFLAMNYCKFCACRILLRSKKRRLSLREQKEILDWVDEVKKYKNKIVVFNLALVDHIASKYGAYKTADPEFVVQYGHDALLRAVDAFDIASGNKFSTYAWWAISRGIFRGFDHYSKGGPKLSINLEDRVEREGYTENHDMRLAAEDLKEKMYAPGLLTEKERAILEARFFLHQTLKDIGKNFGITAEAVRQHERRARKKLKDSYETAPI